MKKISLHLHLLTSLMLLFASTPSQTFAEMFQWTDDNGAIHFSDSQSDVPKNKRVIRRQETRVSSQTSTTSESNRVKVKPVKAKEGHEKGTYDPSVEQELRNVWEAYYDAYARKDADAAADLLVPGSTNEEIRQELRKNRDKMPKIIKDGAVLNLKKVYDQNYATCVAIRDEIVKGQKKTIGYPVTFRKVNGAWKLEKP